MAAANMYQHLLSPDPVTATLNTLLREEESQTPGSDFALALRVAVAQREQSVCQGRDANRAAIAPYRMKRALEYLESHLCSQFRLQDVAAAAGLSPFHFCRQFRIETGLTPFQYVLQRRVENAKRTLRTTDAALVDIALDLGFTSQSHFTAVFRKIAGITPGRFRALCLTWEDTTQLRSTGAISTM